MKTVDRYYNNIYKLTERITKKLFKKNIIQCLKERYELKTKLEKVTGKKIEYVDNNDLVRCKAGYDYSRYKTLCKILEVIETACTLKTFTIEEYENECR